MGSGEMYDAFAGNVLTSSVPAGTRFADCPRKEVAIRAAERKRECYP